MKMNLSRTDREIRLLIAIAVTALCLTHLVTGALAVILIIIGAISLLTSYAGTCPLYSMLKINTREAEMK